MKKILRWFLPAAVAFSAFAACSKEEVQLPDLFKAEYAAAYFLGGDVEGVNAYLLDLAQGRTDENLELISSGAVMRLWINSPVSGDISLPGGTYQGSVSRDRVYTFHCDGQAADGDVRCSYLVLRFDSGAQAQNYPIQGGSMSIKAEAGKYELTVAVQTDDREFTFTYDGEIPTVDCTVPVKNF